MVRRDPKICDREMRTPQRLIIRYFMIAAFLEN